MSDENQNDEEEVGSENPNSQTESFVSKHGCLITIVSILLVGAALGLWGFVSWLER